MDTLAPYIERISFALFTKVSDKSEENLNKIRSTVAQIVLDEIENFIEENLPLDQLKQGFSRKIKKAKEEDDDKLYEQTVATYLELIPDVMTKLDARMSILEVVIEHKIANK